MNHENSDTTDREGDPKSPPITDIKNQHPPNPENPNPTQDTAYEDYSDWIERTSRLVSIEWGKTELHSRISIVISGIGLALLIIYTVFTGCMYYANRDAADAARSAAETAKNALEVENRPWLSAEVEKSDDPINKGEMQFDRDGNFSVIFTVKGENFGKSIAQDIHIYTQLFPIRIGVPFIEIPKRQNELCNKPNVIYVRPGIPFFPGFDLFPSQPYKRGSGAGISKEEVIQGSSFYSSDPLQRRYIEHLYLVGCVDYRSSFGKERHQTRFAYEVLRKGDPKIKGPLGFPLMNFEVGSNISKDSYWLAPSLSGGNYAY